MIASPMQQDAPGRELPASIALVAALLIVLICRFLGAVVIGAWVTAFTIAVGLSRRALRSHILALCRPGPIGASILLIGVAQAIGLPFSIYRNNSIRSAVDWFGLALCYFLARLAFRAARGRRLACFGISIVGSLLACLVVGAGFEWSERLHAVGFNDLVQFKDTFPAILGGGPLGEVATVLLATLPFSIAAVCAAGKGRTWMLPAPILIAAAILVTLSRGTYIALAVFLVAAILYLSRAVFQLRGQITAGVAIFLVGVGSIVGLSRFPESIFRTVRMVGSTAQERSIQGRLRLWSDARAIAETRPYTGVGASNFAVAYLPMAGRQTETPFVGRTFNIGLELWIERGVAGVAAFLAFAIAFLAVSWKAARNAGDAATKAAAGIFALAFLALLLRDTTYSSLLGSSTSALIAIAAAHNCSAAGSKEDL